MYLRPAEHGSVLILLVAVYIAFLLVVCCNSMCLLADTNAFDAVSVSERKVQGFHNIHNEERLDLNQLDLENFLCSQTLAQLTKLANQLTMLWEQSCWTTAKNDCLRCYKKPGGDCSMSSDNQPLLNNSPQPSPPSRKRRNTSTASHHVTCFPYEKLRPGKLKIPPGGPLRADSLTQLSPGAIDRHELVNQWLQLNPDPKTLSPPEPRRTAGQRSDVINIPDSELKTFVMIQVFERDTLLKNELIPLCETDNTEISISYSREEPPQPSHRETTFFRPFQISSTDSNNYVEFRRQFGKGIRLFCAHGKIVQLKKSTQLMTFYGTKATPDWQEIKCESNWEKIFDFEMLKARRRSKDFDFETYNKKTACVDNTVRVTVGCEPNEKHIYETEFHIKLSFIVH